ncbi:hemerythrin domain-containing protein [Ningiella sp. W23]|uniref:hemerythrin domain-containing protein n=1 Tax=Ningiella sp. W23 TaxID=3023715 RepID=UPI0037569E7C
MKIFEALRQDHDKQRALMKALVETSGESILREEFYKQLKNELNKHSVAEERHFYSPLIQYDNTVELSRHGIAEHHQIDKLIEKLDATDMSSSAWLTSMKQLKDKVEHHLTEEETEFFKIAGKALNSEQKESLADEYLDEMQN